MTTRAQALASGALLLLGVAGVATVQPRLAKIAHAAKEQDDVYALPPPGPLHVATLGWDAAAVDLIWSRLLVDYGTHWAEHRDFKNVPLYVDAILELEPTYWPLYRYIDTMLAYRPLQGTEDDARRARAYLERGTHERAGDWRVWLEYGQFLAYIGPSFLHDDAERQAWRNDGALALGRAVDLGADAGDALSAATLLSGAGARAQAIAYLRRAYVFTTHPSMAEVHELIGRRLVALQASSLRDDADKATAAIDAKWHEQAPFLSRDLYVVVGPFPDAFACAGTTHGGDAACARDWTVPAKPSSVSEPESFASSP